jgi:hypothetical protein
MLRKIHGTNFFHIKFLSRSNIKCQNGRVLPPAQGFYFNGQALRIFSTNAADMTEGSLQNSRQKWKIIVHNSID